MEKLTEQACNFDLDIHPGIAGSELYRTFRLLLGNDDPLKGERDIENRQALAAYPIAKNMVNFEVDSLLAAIKVSASGNILDSAFGGDINIENVIRNSIKEPLSADDYTLFLMDLERAHSLTLVTDNAGEIVFDKLLLEEINKWRNMHNLLPLEVNVMVKGGPIYNDAMEEDAIASGMNELAGIVNSGTDIIGLHTGFISNEALDILKKSDLIIFKGLANYESELGNEPFSSRVYFLFRAKCRLIARHLNIPVNSQVLIKNKREEK